ncbi:MAG: ATP-binding protein [Candidatus Binatia bacterium]
MQILPEGGAIDVNLLPVHNGYAGFEVGDNGPGMSDAIRARIFEPFFSRREDGPGLGLTFVQRVVHDHRGRVTVESEPGRGTVFRVSLPVAEVAE